MQTRQQIALLALVGTLGAGTGGFAQPVSNDHLWSAARDSESAAQAAPGMGDGRKPLELPHMVGEASAHAKLRVVNAFQGESLTLTMGGEWERLELPAGTFTSYARVPCGGQQLTVALPDGRSEEFPLHFAGAAYTLFLSGAPTSASMGVRAKLEFDWVGTATMPESRLRVVNMSAPSNSELLINGSPYKLQGAGSETGYVFLPAGATTLDFVDQASGASIAAADVLLGSSNHYSALLYCESEEVAATGSRSYKGSFILLEDCCDATELKAMRTAQQLELRRTRRSGDPRTGDAGTISLEEMRKDGPSDRP